MNSQKYVVKRILYLLLIIPLFGIPIINYYFDTLYTILFRYIVLGEGALLLIIFWGTTQNKQVDAYFYLFGLFCLYSLINTLKNKGDYTAAVTTFLPSFCMLLIIESFDEDLGLILDIIREYLYTLVFINQIFIFLYPNGMYVSTGIEGYSLNWLLGYKSTIQYFVWPLCILTILKKDTKFKTYVALVLCNLQAITSSNQMLIASLIVIDIIYIFRNEKMKKVVNIYSIQILYIVLNFVFVSGLYDSIQSLVYLIANAFHKNVTSGRMNIWRSTLNQIPQKLFFGHGRVDSSIRYGMYGRVSHSHNVILEILYQGGIVWLANFIVFNLHIAHLLWQKRDSETTWYICIGILGIYLMSIVEIYLQPVATGIWLIFALASKVDFLETDYCLDNDQEAEY